MKRTAGGLGTRNNEDFNPSLLVLMIMGMLCGKTSLKSIAHFAKAHQVELARQCRFTERKSPVLQHVSASQFTGKDRSDMYSI